MAGCASQGPEFGGQLTPATTGANPPNTPSPYPAPVIQVQTQTVARLPSPGAYQLSQEELALDCRRLTGRMAVRIVQIRDFQIRSQTSGLARTLQASVKPVFGDGSGGGTDPASQYARDRAMLEAYNQQLAARQCANFDLDAELAPGATEPPKPRPPKKT
jgi:hypothetical protein